MSRRLTPNSTQIPNVIIDEWMPGLSAAEFKVILFVAKAFSRGECPGSDAAGALRINQINAISEGTRLSRRTVSAAYRSLEDSGRLLTLRALLEASGDC